MTLIWTKDITTKQSDTVICVGYFYAKTFLNVDVFKSFDFILHDIILLNVLIVGDGMLTKYLSLNV